VQNHRIVRQRFGPADRGSPTIGIGFQSAEESRPAVRGFGGEMLKRLSQIDYALAEAGFPTFLDVPD